MMLDYVVLAKIKMRLQEETESGKLLENYDKLLSSDYEIRESMRSEIKDNDTVNVGTLVHTFKDNPEELEKRIRDFSSHEDTSLLSIINKEHHKYSHDAVNQMARVAIIEETPGFSESFEPDNLSLREEEIMDEIQEHYQDTIHEQLGKNPEWNNLLTQEELDELAPGVKESEAISNLQNEWPFIPTEEKQVYSEIISIHILALERIKIGDIYVPDTEIKPFDPSLPIMYDQDPINKRELHPLDEWSDVGSENSGSFGGSTSDN